ncbi:hypothetical protein BDF19DRAFT_445429 [Syncephalis fuscata]|nr:hypothetical protein BDF19DRAFT_445429 [Syncephalis fuscata]
MRFIISLLLPEGNITRTRLLFAFTSLIDVVNEFIDGTPLLIVLSLRYVWPNILDTIFMDTATILADRPYIYRYWQEFRHYLQRSVRRLRWLIAYRLATLLPYVGPIIVMGISFYMTRQSFGRRLAYTGSRQLARELLEPYFCRMDMDGRMRREWFKRRNAATFGFGQTWTNLLVYIVAQAAIIELVSTQETLSRKPKNS